MLDLTGQRFGRLVARKPTAERRQKSVVWLCDCDCGATDVKAPASELRFGRVESCKCLMREVNTALAKAMHGPTRRGKCQCGKRFTTREPHQKYCSRKCWPSTRNRGNVSPARDNP